MFNNLMDTFFTELIKIFPRDNCIKINYMFFQGICKTSSKTPCNDFMTGVIPLLEKITKRDETFFTGIDKPNFLNYLKFNNLWILLSPSDKSIIWQYIEKFILIGVNIVEIPIDSLQLINKIKCN